MTHFPSSAAIITNHTGKKRKKLEFSDKQMRDLLYDFFDPEYNLNYYIDTSVLLGIIPLVKFINATSGTRVVYFP